jgi:outer membrane protein OmpA-like peptidoglycan-associated protein
MKKYVLIVLACTASLFAQTAVEVASIDTKISCRVAFDELKTLSRDAAADRMYASVDSKIYALENLPREKRKGEQYESELKSCGLSVDLLKLQLENVALNRSYIASQREISAIKSALIDAWSGDVKALGASIERISEESQKSLAEKDYLIRKQKEEAEKKLEALRSKAISVFKDARGTILSMSDILFETAKADLKPELKENLAEVAGILKTLLNESNVTVEGYTDNVGKAESNKKLSEQRAGAVMKYLIDRGVDKKRLKSVGYGASKFVADNNTEEGKAKNRRVELVIKDK